MKDENSIKNEQESKMQDRKFSLRRAFIIIFSIGFLFILINISQIEYLKDEISLLEKDRSENCRQDIDVIFLWNHNRSDALNIHTEEIINMSYLSLYEDGGVYCPSGMQDCFLEIKIEKCCIVGDDYLLYCRESPIFKEDKT